MSATDTICKVIGTVMKPDFIKAVILIASLFFSWWQYSGKVEAKENWVKQVQGLAQVMNKQEFKPEKKHACPKVDCRSAVWR